MMVPAGRPRGVVAPAGSEARRIVVAGPRNSGKNAWALAQAKPGDLVWSLQQVAHTIQFGSRHLLKGPKNYAKNREAAAAARRCAWAMQRAFLEWVASADFDGRMSVYVVVPNVDTARFVARLIGAQLVVLKKAPEAVP
jgi:hypothetical protein